VLGALERLRLVLAGVWLASGLVLAAILTWATRRGLAPLVELARTIGALDETGLSRSVALQGPVPAEVEPLVGSLREMLARLAAAFARERTLVSNVAHELRTPLAGLRTTLEVALMAPDPPAGTREEFARCLAMVTAMQTMVENLLALARLESGQSPVRQRPLDLDGLLRECWRPFEAAASERGLAVSWDLAQAAALGDEEKLRIVFRNLFANATTYADTGGSVRVQSAIAGDRVLVRIANSGCALAPEQAELVFDRFWRADASRSGEGAHCGLGMPLARQIVELLGGAIAVRCEREEEFVVEMLLPLAPQAAAERPTEPPPGGSPGKERPQ
jgi:signal transduction histidine kinase